MKLSLVFSLLPKEEAWTLRIEGLKTPLLSFRIRPSFFREGKRIALVGSKGTSTVLDHVTFRVLEKLSQKLGLKRDKPFSLEVEVKEC